MLRFAHPPLGPQSIRAASPRLRVALTERLALPLPLIAYDLPWASIAPPRAAVVADALDALGITVAALRCELGEVDRTPNAAVDANPGRLCPYRPDRYGLTADDLTAAKIVDVRLAACRDPSGHFTYAPERMQRWDLRLTRALRNVHSHTAMPVRHWPPDVASIDKLPTKISQLRQLAPSAAICVSLETSSLDRGLPIVVRSQAELLAIRADDWSPAYGKQLAGVIVSTRKWLNANSPIPVRLVVVPPPSITADDVVKLLALGADMVAVDSWCGLLMDRSPSEEADDWAVATLGVSTRPATDAAPSLKTAAIEERLGRITALVESMGVASVTELNLQHLIALDAGIPGMKCAGL